MTCEHFPFRRSNSKFAPDAYVTFWRTLSTYTYPQLRRGLPERSDCLITLAPQLPANQKPSKLFGQSLLKCSIDNSHSSFLASAISWDSFPQLPIRNTVYSPRSSIVGNSNIEIDGDLTPMGSGSCQSNRIHALSYVYKDRLCHSFQHTLVFARNQWLFRFQITGKSSHPS
jgi:hypothetical protein